MRRTSPPRILGSLVVALGLAVSGPAPAQSLAPTVTDAPKAPVVTMPVVKKDEGAVYPRKALEAGIHDAASVPLELTIDETGAVTHVVVERPVGNGFDEAAVEAAQKLVFEPATRDGRPVASRIRFIYRFTPPPGVLSGRVLKLAGDR